MIPLIFKLVLSPEGEKRLNSLYEKISAEMPSILRIAVSKSIKREVVRRAPSEREEADIISAPGESWDPVHFFKGLGQLWIKEVIAQEPTLVTPTETGHKATFGDPERMNKKIGFSWHFWEDREAGKLGTGRSDDPEAGPFWRNLIEAFESGGTVTIVGRIDKKTGKPRKLFLGPLDRRDFVTKTIAPKNMFFDGIAHGTDLFIKIVASMIRKIVKKI